MKRQGASTEGGRQEALPRLDLSDMPDDKSLDVFAQMAVSLLGAEIAAIEFLDGRMLRLKSCIGVDIASISSKGSFCSHVIKESSGILVVEDARLDARFAEHPMVAMDGGVRFYAGAVFHSPDGTRLGAICVAGRQPRQVDSEFSGNLARMAQGVSMAVALHWTSVETRRRERTDELTGLSRLSVFMDAVSTLSKDGHVMLMMADIEGMGALNGLLGREAGDSVLREAGRRVATWSKARKAACGRMGGDEFLVAVPGKCSARRVEALARSFGECLSGLFVPEGLTESVRLRASVGVAISTWHGTDVEGMMRAAEASLSTALKNGLLIGKAHDETPVLAGRREASAMLDEAFRKGGTKPFRLDYQPIVNCANGTLVGFESLVRWDAGNGRTWPPSCFIPVAESSGLIADLDAWCLRRACEDAMRWKGELPVSVNVSAAGFISGSIENRVKDVLAVTGLPPRRLKLEVTETALLPGRKRTQEAMASLQAMGVRIMLDDFGCGHASFAYLRDHTFDGIKIDKAFVQGAEEGGKARVLLRTLAELASLMGIETVAEGVETMEQLQVVRSEGIEVIQGYFLGRPAPAAVTAEAVERHLAGTSGYPTVLQRPLT